MVMVKKLSFPWAARGAFPLKANSISHEYVFFEAIDFPAENLRACLQSTRFYRKQFREY